MPVYHFFIYLFHLIDDSVEFKVSLEVHVEQFDILF